MTLHLHRRILTNPLPLNPSLLLRLPPTCRTFHTTPSPQYLAPLLQTSTTLIETLHSTTHLPWAYTIPLTALLLRLTLLLPLSLTARRTSQKRASLHPLLSAWSHTLRTTLIRDPSISSLGPDGATKVIMKKFNEKQEEIYARHSIQRWKMYLPALSLPIWLLAVESIRRMSGAREGILGLLFSSNSPSNPPASSPTEGSENGILEVAAQGELLPLDSTSLFEPTLATEGILWFPNLLHPDPQLILPFLFSSVVIANAWHSFTPSTTTQSWQRGLRKSMFVIGLAIGPLTLQVPSGLLLYLISSSSFALGQAVILDRAMPIGNPVMGTSATRRKVEGGEGRVVIKR